MTGPETTVIRHRTAASIAWCVIATCVLLSGLSSIPQLAMATWFGTLVVLLVTGRLDKTMKEEQLVRSRAYHAVAGGVFGIAIVGCVLGMLPMSSERSQLLAVFFGIVALLAYRVLVARGPKPTMLLVASTSFAWLPAALVMMVTCKCGHHETDWTESASRSLFVTLLVAICGLVAVTLLAFRRRTTDLPDARIL